jgi:Leucine-rich repeat (LRR) protein
MHENSLNFSKELKIIDLSRNRLRKLHGGMFASNQQIEVLIVGSNYLEEIDPRTFHSLPELYQLDLANNRIADLHSNLFRSNQKLARLLIYNNKLTQLSAAVFTPIPQLTVLLLNANRINAVDRTILQALPNLENFHLGGNVCTIYNFNTLVPNVPIDFTRYYELLEECFSNYDKLG